MFTDFLTRILEEEATAGDSYDEQYVIIVLSKQDELNILYGLLFANQSQNATEIRKTTKLSSHKHLKRNRTFEKNRDVNKKHIPAKYTSNIYQKSLKRLI